MANGIQLEMKYESEIIGIGTLSDSDAFNTAFMSYHRVNEIYTSNPFHISNPNEILLKWREEREHHSLYYVETYPFKRQSDFTQQFFIALFSPLFNGELALCSKHNSY